MLRVGADSYLTHDAVLALHDLGLVNPRRIRTAASAAGPSGPRERPSGCAAPAPSAAGRAAMTRRRGGVPMFLSSGFLVLGDKGRGDGDGRNGVI